MFKRKKLAVAIGLLMCSMAFTVGAPLVQAEGLPELTTLIKQNSAAVVNIRVDGKMPEHAAMGKMPELPDGMQLPPALEQLFRNLPEMQPDNHASQAVGSGFILSPDGYIITNAHVVENAKTVTVALSDKRELTAEIVGSDKLSDVAVLKIKADGLPVVQLGNSDALEVGQWVVAIGAPFGLDHTATQGIVSALSRSLPDGTYVPFIQTDAAVNPGNSGGPLFNLNGQVIGVNSQIYSRSGGYMGISFAIPINVVKNVVDQIKTKGQVSRGWLGVEIQDMDQKLASSFNLSQPNGALVASVQAGSPADKAGVQAGDIITGFGDAPVKSASDLPLLVGNTPIGKQVPLKVLRTGSEKVMQVTVDQLADKSAKAEHTEVAKTDTGSLGIVASVPSATERQANKLADNGGVIVREVRPGSPADQAGLESGDAVLAVNNRTIHSAEELKSTIKEAPDDKPLAMLIVREDKTQFIAITKTK